MIIRTIIIGVCSALTITAQASAVQIVRANEQSNIRLQKMVDRWSVPTASGRVKVIYGSRAIGGQTFYDPITRTIYVGSGGLNENAFAHELGHDYDEHRLSAVGFDIWRLWLKVRYQREEVVQHILAPVGQDDGGRYLAREYFADWYAGCATRGRSFSMYSLRRPIELVSDYGLKIRKSVLRKTCKSIWRLPRI